MKKILNENSGGIHYSDKMNEYIAFIKKLDTIISNIYSLDNLFHYFNFDVEREKIINGLNLDYCDIGIKLEIIRAFCIDEMTDKTELIKLLEEDVKGEQQ